jgi:hypothetical protein
VAEGQETSEVEKPGAAPVSGTPTSPAPPASKTPEPKIMEVKITRTDGREVMMNVEQKPDYVDSGEGLAPSTAVEAGSVEINGLALDTRESFKAFLTEQTRSEGTIEAYCYDTRWLRLYERLDTHEPLPKPVPIDLNTYVI